MGLRVLAIIAASAVVLSARASIGSPDSSFDASLPTVQFYFLTNGGCTGNDGGNVSSGSVASVVNRDGDVWGMTTIGEPVVGPIERFDSPGILQFCEFRFELPYSRGEPLGSTGVRIGDFTYWEADVGANWLDVQYSQIRDGSVFDARYAILDYETH